MKYFWLSIGSLSIASSFIIPIVLKLIGFITLNNIGIVFILSMAFLISGFVIIKHILDMY